MTVFGKKLSEYVAFEKPALILIAAVGVARLALSLAGVSDSATKWLSMTAVSVVAAIYYAVTVHTKGFGSYRQLLPLYFLQAVVAHTIAVAGILISAATGKANVFTANEYGGDSPVAQHVLGHVAGGMLVGPLIAWLIGSIVLFVTKKVKAAPKPAPAAA
jgi:hypothetical protein